MLGASILSLPQPTLPHVTAASSWFPMAAGDICGQANPHIWLSPSVYFLEGKKKKAFQILCPFREKGNGFFKH